MKYLNLILLTIFFSNLLFGLESKSLPQPTESPNKLEQTKNKNEAGALIYENHCIVCHRDGLMGAPRSQNEKDWHPRLDKRTLEDLLASAIKGINGMPARGTCPECSDEDLKAAIQFMLPHHE